MNKGSIIAGNSSTPGRIFPAFKSKLEFVKGFIFNVQRRDQEAAGTLEQAKDAGSQISVWEFKDFIPSRYLRRYIESVGALDSSLQINSHNKDKDAGNQSVIRAKKLTNM